MHLTLRLAPNIDDRGVVESAQSYGIRVRALSTFAIAPTEEARGLVIGYGNTRAEDIPGAVSVLAKLVR